MARIFNARFKPFTYEELAAPLREATAAHQAQEQMYDELITDADKMKAFLNEDWQSYKDYKEYIDQLNAAADDLARHGLTRQNRGAVFKLKRDYNGKIQDINSGILRRENEMENFRKSDIGQSPRYIGPRPEDYSVDEYMHGNNPFKMGVNGSEISKFAEDRTVKEMSRLYREYTKDGYMINEVGVDPGITEQVMYFFGTGKNFNNSIDNPYYSSNPKQYDYMQSILEMIRNIEASAKDVYGYNRFTRFENGEEVPTENSNKFNSEIFNGISSGMQFNREISVDEYELDKRKRYYDQFNNQPDFFGFQYDDNGELVPMYQEGLDERKAELKNIGKSGKGSNGGSGSGNIITGLKPVDNVIRNEGIEKADELIGLTQSEQFDEEKGQSVNVFSTVPIRIPGNRYFEDLDFESNLEMYNYGKMLDGQIDKHIDRIKELMQQENDENNTPKYMSNMFYLNEQFSITRPIDITTGKTKGIYKIRVGDMPKRKRKFGDFASKVIEEYNHMIKDGVELNDVDMEILQNSIDLLKASNTKQVFDDGVEAYEKNGGKVLSDKEYNYVKKKYNFGEDEDVTIQGIEKKKSEDKQYIGSFTQPEFVLAGSEVKDGKIKNDDTLAQWTSGFIESTKGDDAVPTYKRSEDNPYIFVRDKNMKGRDFIRIANVGGVETEAGILTTLTSIHIDDDMLNHGVYDENGFQNVPLVKLKFNGGSKEVIIPASYFGTTFFRNALINARSESERKYDYQNNTKLQKDFEMLGLNLQDMNNQNINYGMYESKYYK